MAIINTNTIDNEKAVQKRIKIVTNVWYYYIFLELKASLQLTFTHMFAIFHVITISHSDKSNQLQFEVYML